ncbi:MAG TPA: adenosine deaminase [Terriglobales bacterium]|nr:adenosine deaminase [Terriglobales bacterium]
MDLRRLPKVELHLHLDCSMSYRLASRLQPSLTRSQFDEEFIAPARCTNLADFLKRPPKIIALMQTEENLRASVDDLFQQLQKDNVIYVEPRFAPLLHQDNGLKPQEVVEIVDSAVDLASKQSGIQAGLILCTLRHYSTAQSMETVKLVEQFRGRRVVALDIAGDEAGYPVDAHVPAFAYAAEKKLGRIAHAGEALGPESVWESLKHFTPSRIGHGTRSTEDPALMEHLRKTGIHLEVCPSSNIQTNMYERYEDHPIRDFADSGISFNVNTDCRTVNNLTLTDEYERLHQAFRWQKEFLQANLYGVRASFAPEPVKLELAERLTQAYSDL